MDKNVHKGAQGLKKTSAVQGKMIMQYLHVIFVSISFLSALFLFAFFHVVAIHLFIYL